MPGALSGTSAISPLNNHFPVIPACGRNERINQRFPGHPVAALLQGQLKP